MSIKDKKDIRVFIYTYYEALHGNGNIEYAKEDLQKLSPTVIETLKHAYPRLR